MHNRIALLKIAALFLWLFFFVPLIQAQSETGISSDLIIPKKVLLLNSYHKGYLWTDEITRGVEETFADTDIELHIEYMDTKRQFNADFQNLLRQVLRLKHHKHHYDAVISSDNNAFDFLKEWGEQIFGNVPFVFCGINYLQNSDIEGLTHYTGVNEKMDIAGNLALIRQLHPDRKKVVVITDNTTTGKQIQKEISRVAALEKNNDLQIDLLFDVSTDELRKKMQSLGEQTVVLFTIFIRDKNEVFLGYEQGMKLVCNNTRVPIYATQNFNSGLGIVGGYLTTGYDQGSVAASQARLILSGKPVSDVPIRWDTPTRPRFDYPQLKRHGIPLDLLPLDSEILHQPVSFYYQNKMLIWNTTLAFCLLLLALLGVTHGLFRSHRAEEEIKYRSTIDAAMAEVSSLFVFSDEVDYNSILQIMGETVSVNRAYIFQIQENGSKLSNIFEWCAHGTDPQIDMLQDLEASIFPWWIKQLQNGKNITIKNMDELPPEASAEKEILQNQQILSLIAVPIWSKERTLWGFMGFDDTEKTRDWTGTEIEALQIVGEMISGDMKRRSFEAKIARFGHIFEESLNEIYLFDADTLKFVEVNRAAQHNLGYTMEELQNLTPLDLRTEFTTQLFEKLVMPLRKGEKKKIVFTSVLKRKDQSLYDVEVHLQLLKYEHKILFTAIILDITERKRAEDTLRESEKKYRQLFKNAPAGIYEIDFEKVRFINVNDIMCKYTGYSKKEFLSMNPLDLLTEDSKTLYMGRLEKLSTGEKLSGNVEYNLIKKDGQKVSVILNSDFIYENGKLKGARVVAHDITDRKKAEEEKIKAQKIAGENEKLALVGQIAGKMAHDFNNVLGVIMGNAQLSLLNSKEPKTKKTLELIFQQTIRGKNLTRNLVAFARDQEPKQEFFKINEKMDLVLSLLRKDLEGIELIREDKTGMPDLLADPGMIEHALVNLIQNSIHATSMVENPRITMRSYCSDNHICFEIEDNGCGIPTKYLENIFEPSFTLKGSRDVTGSYKTGIKGTGYGMANVKKYIEQHKGNISIESEFGLGTKFTIRLPIIKKKLTNEEKTEIREEKAYFEKYILLVEDEQAISDVQYSILTQEPCSHKVDTAYNGKIAMDLLARNQYDLVSLDYVLPGDINGMDVYNHIRATDKTIPILFISGNIEFLESIKDLKQNDAHIDHQSKPCPNKDYVNSINELFKRI